MEAVAVEAMTDAERGPLNGDALAPGEEEGYLSWAGLRERMSDSSRSDEGRAAGVWAIDRLSRYLPDGWLRSSAGRGLCLAPFHAIAFAELVELALRLDLLGDVPGMAKVRRDLIRDVTAGRRYHTRIELEAAGLAAQHGYPVRLEDRLHPGVAPTDVIITTPWGTVAAETFAVLLDDRMRAGMAYSEALSAALNQACWEHQVCLDGQLGEVLSEADTAAWAARIAEAAALVRADGHKRPVEHRAGRVWVLRMEDAHSGVTSFSGPPLHGADNDRLGLRLAGKGAQAVQAGATWVRADALDGLWQFTPWSMWPLPAKAEAIAAEVRRALSPVEGLEGAVLSSGPAMAQGEFRGESARVAGGGFALRRLLPAGRVRETIIVPVRDDPVVDLWRELYDAEPAWLDWALTRTGLSPSADILTVRPVAP